MEALQFRRVRERIVAVQEYDERPPWERFTPDPDPPTPAMMGGKLREIAPGLHYCVGRILDEHLVAQRHRWLLRAIMSPFEIIADALPADVAAILVPVEDIRHCRPSSALALVTRAKKLRSKRGKRMSFRWPHQAVYEASGVLLQQSRNTAASRKVREAYRAAYKLFVRVAVTLAKMFERQWTKPDTAQARRRQIAA